MKKTFAVVNQWPHIPNAEKENIARLEIAAKKIGLNCILIDKWGKRLDNHVEINYKDVDFVIHLHFETAKSYDAFSYVTLWNPLHFFYEWGYQRYSKNLATHDDALSCHSQWADDHYLRQIFSDPSRLPPCFYLNHSLTTTKQPTVRNNRKLFYCGINWERVGGPKGRLDDVLKTLDNMELIKIYGPRKLQGVKVWKGYKGYVEPIPFDGVTSIEKIADCGISLVFSSKAHIYSSLMSNRLFESAAAGAVILIDENPFAKKFFGDSLIYINMNQSQEKINQEIIAKIEWINNFPEEAYQLAVKAQNIFLEHFDLAKQLDYIYTHHEQRQKKLAALYLAQQNKYRVVILHRYENSLSLQKLIDDLQQQNYSSLFLIILANPSSENKNELDSSLAKASILYEIIYIHSYHLSLGSHLEEIYPYFKSDDLLLCVQNQRLYHDHISSLVKKFEDNPKLVIAISDFLSCHAMLEQKLYESQRDIESVFRMTNAETNTLTSFLLKFSALELKETYFWRYLEKFLPHYLILKNPEDVAYTLRGTCEIKSESPNQATPSRLNKKQNKITIQSILDCNQQFEIIKDRFPNCPDERDKPNMISVYLYQLIRNFYHRIKAIKFLAPIAIFLKSVYKKVSHLWKIFF